jgi:hypothetical protein
MQNKGRSKPGIRAKAVVLSVLGVVLGAGVANFAVASTSVGFLIYRVYLPEGGSSKVTLPGLTYSYSDGRAAQTIKPCSTTLQSTPSGSGAPGCAWLLKVAGPTAASGINIAYPDASSTYWVTPFPVDPALSISVNGQYPDARYMSFNVYDSSGSSFVSNGVYSGLADYLIAPDAGSANPWQQSALPGGAYTLQISTAAVPGMRNVLPMPPSDGGTPTGLPPTCKGKDECPAYKVFQPAGLGGLFPNVDNAYVSALTQPEPGRVLVIRGKLPASPSGDQSTHPVPWPAAGSQLRYWSICNNLYLEPYPVTSCAADYQLKTDSQGYYTVVASATADRPVNATEAYGVAWLQNSKLLPYARHMLIVRNMLPNQFSEAIQNIPSGGGSADAQSVMKAYYPQVWSCSKAIYEAGGWKACAH